MARTDSFVFYLSFREATKEMSDAEALETILGICDYALYGDEPTLTSPLSRAVFAVAKPVIDSNLAKKTGGKNGGRPRKTEKPMVFEEKTYGFEKNNHRFSKSKSNVNENENENVNENANENENENVNDEDGEEEKESAAAKLRDEGLARVMSLYLERIEPMPSRTSVELLKGYVEQLGPDICVRAIERSIDAGARKWTYIHAILKNCEKDGIRSLADWDAREAEQAAGRSKFKPPGVNEVAAYVRERGSRVDPQGFIDYYSAKGWMIGKAPMTDWKAACRNAEKWDMWNKPAQPGGRNKPVDRPEPSGNNFLQHGRNGLLRIKREEGEK